MITSYINIAFRITTFHRRTERMLKPLSSTKRQRPYWASKTLSAL